MASSSLGTSSCLKNLNLNHKSLYRSKVKLPPPVVVKLPPSDSDGVGPHWLVGRAAAVLLATSLCLADPALAFKGGGPYGAQVTRGQDLTGKDFSGQTLIKQDFKTDICMVSTMHQTCQLYHPVLVQSDKHIDPILSILRQANFKGAKLLGASFFDADLTAADMSDADLRGADFTLANLTKVNLQNANLEGALATGNTSFRGSIINGADFTDVPLRDDQKEYLCKVADGVNPTTGNATRETLLCE